jgi:hypothetical protein
MDAEEIDDTALRRIGKDAARFLSTGRPLFAPRQRVEIAESFPLWTIHPQVLSPGRPGSIESSAHPLRRWYHQLLIGGEPQAYAISQEKRGGHDVVQVMRSGLPARVDSAIDVIDERFPSASRVRLIDFAPAYLHALWFLADGAQNVMVVSAPTEAGFHVGETTSETDFLTGLGTFLEEHRILGLEPSRAESPVPVFGRTALST